MQFQIDGQKYFLHFAEDEGRWYVLYQTPQGVRRVPVMHDMPQYEPLRFVIAPSKEEKNVVN